MAMVAEESNMNLDNDIVHLRHSLDGYPLCWPMDREGSFDATSNPGGVTCKSCITYMGD